MTKMRLGNSLLTMVLLGLLMWGWVVTDLQETRRRDLDAAAQKGAILTQVLERYMVAMTQKMNARLSEFVFRFQREIAAGRNQEGIQASLSRNLLLYPEVRGFQVMDAQGRLLFTDEGLFVPLDSETSGFFQKLRNNPEAGVVISRPLQSSVTDEWLIMFGHRLENAKGAFVGVAALIVRCSFFEDFAFNLKLAPGETIALSGPDRKLILHLPRLPDGAATPLEKTAFAAALASGEHESAFFLQDPQDGTNRLFYFRDMRNAEPKLPFAVMLGQEERYILTAWRQRMVIYVVLCGVITFVLVFLMRALLLNYHRVEDQAERLEREVKGKDSEWRALLDSFPDPAWLVDLEGRYLAVNKTFCTRLEKTEEEVINHHYSTILSTDEEIASFTQGREDVLEQKAPMEQIIWVCLKGKQVPIEIRRVPVFDDEGKICALAGVARNLSTRYEMESQQNLLTQLFENNHEGLLVMDAKEKIILANQAFAEAIGYSQEDILGHYPGEFRAPCHDIQFVREIGLRLKTHGSWRGEFVLLHKDGREVPMECRIMPLADRMKRANWIVFMTNLSERRASEAHIDALANVDVLTGLPNRASFARVLKHQLETKSASAMLMLDINQLSRINDAYGHLAGDYLLRRIGKRMRRLLRGQDVLGRLGDDQFGIVLGEADARGVEIVIRKLMNMVSKPVVIEGDSVTSTVCIGASLVPTDGEDAETIMRNADAAMHYARALGPSNYRFFSPEMNLHLTERLRRENDLRSALEHNELRLYYQPQVEVSGERIVGCEALLRWIHPEKGVVPPLDFIPLAEETGLILPIGKWALEEACRQNKAWQDKGLPPITMAVNLSAVQFQDTSLIDNVVHALESTGLEARWLELEITESVLMQDPEQVVAILENLKALGVRLSIDDFGTGYSSLAYLKRFPIDKIKIDRSFIQDLSTDADDAVIVRMVLGMVRELCLQAIAEGVEDREQLGFLMACQCQEYQGYLCSRPLPGKEFEVLLGGDQKQSGA
jgi:diguanylate cyclase (GGDEF)-like protein/PAS domain S-box-containing protein